MENAALTLNPGRGEQGSDHNVGTIAPGMFWGF